MGKEVAAHIQGISIGLASGGAVVTNFGGASFYAVALISLVLAAISYGFDKRGGP